MDRLSNEQKITLYLTAQSIAKDSLPVWDGIDYENADWEEIFLDFLN